MARSGASLNKNKFIEIIDTSPKMDALLDRKAEIALEAAKTIYESRSHHDDRHEPEYRDSFFTRKRRTLDKRGRPVNGRQIGNRSKRWYWVEFGAHAGGKTPVLHYRPLGLALDVLSSG